MSRIAQKDMGCNTQTLEIQKNTGESLVDIGANGKEKPWRTHKIGNGEVTELFKVAQKLEPGIISKSRLQALSECASFLLFDRNQQGRLRLNSANFCRVRLCPMCSWRRSLKLFSQVSEIVGTLLQRLATTRFIFVTLTVPNCKGHELASTMNAMNKAFSFIVGKGKTFAPAKKFKSNLLGYMKATEITYNQQSDTYHPHIHCLFAVRSDYFCRGYIKQKEWRGIWSQAMKSDRELIVHVEAVKGCDAKAVAEISKYPVKQTDLINITDTVKSIEALIILHTALKGRRLVTFGGVLAAIKRELKLEDVEAANADLIHTDNEQFTAVERVLFRWCKIGAYIC